MIVWANTKKIWLIGIICYLISLNFCNLAPWWNVIQMLRLFFSGTIKLIIMFYFDKESILLTRISDALFLPFLAFFSISNHQRRTTFCMDLIARCSMSVWRKIGLFLNLLIARPWELQHRTTDIVSQDQQLTPCVAVQLHASGLHVLFLRQWQKFSQPKNLYQFHVI